MRAPYTYTAFQMKEWGASYHLENGGCVPARPLPVSGLELKRRFMSAWKVFTGKCDVLDWNYDLPQYRYLKEGEIIRNGDEADVCADGWRDEPRWIPVNPSRIGRPASDPTYPSHVRYRRQVNTGTPK